MTRGTPEHAQWVRGWYDAARSRGHVTRDAFLEWARAEGTSRGCAYPTRADVNAIRDDERNLAGWEALRAPRYDVPPVATTPPPVVEPVAPIDVDVSELDAVSTHAPQAPLDVVSTRGDRLLVIPDVHSNPGYDNARFAWVGRMIAELQPEHVLCLGDFWDLHSLSSYDKGKRSAENARVRGDIDHGFAAMDMLCEPWSKGAWKPKSLTFTVGNHEDRIARVGNDAPELDGILGVESLKIPSWGWTVSPYRVPVRVCGFVAAHYLVSGIMGRPIGGMNAAATILRLHHESAIVGHSHVYDRKELLTASERRLLAIVAGCWTHPDDVSGWCTPQAAMWRRVITLIHDARDGFGDVEEYGYERVRARWGRG